MYCKHCDKPSFLNALRTCSPHSVYTCPTVLQCLQPLLWSRHCAQEDPWFRQIVFCPVSRPPLFYVLDLMHAISLGLVWLVPYPTSCVGSQNKVAYYESWISSFKDCDKRVNYQRLCMEIRQEWTPAETWRNTNRNHIQYMLATYFLLCILSSTLEISPWRPQHYITPSSALAVPCTVKAKDDSEGDGENVRRFWNTDLAHLFAMSHKKNFMQYFKENGCKVSMLW